MPTLTEVGPGSLLVSAPSMLDPNFRRTVVFVIDHQEEGTLGVVLNRPGDTSVSEILPDWGPYVGEPGIVFVGGPVERRAALCLAWLRTGLRLEHELAELPAVISARGTVALIDLDEDPEPLMDKVRGLRVFGGYAGWDSGQLAQEIAREDWFVVPSLPSDVLADPARDLWGQVLRRQGVPMALLATHPGDLQRN